MKPHVCSSAVCCVLVAAIALRTVAERVVEQVVVFKEADRFAGWPANYGIWSWGDEIVVGFSLGYHSDDKKGGHPIDRDKPRTKRQARSVDGGRTWTIETPDFVDDAGKRSTGRSNRPADSISRIPISRSPFAWRPAARAFRRFAIPTIARRPGRDRFNFPTFGRKGIFARTDYIVNGKHDLMAFLTAAKDEGGEGWPFCTRTTDGGKTWKHVGWIGPQPGPGGYAIMPSTLRLKNGSLLSIIRRRGKFDDGERWWLEAFLSPNDGQSWYMLDKPRLPNKGNPAHMIRLQDGRIALTYGLARRSRTECARC